MILDTKGIEKCILSCAGEFSGGIGLKRLAKVLYGKSTLGEKAKNSKYFGALSDYSITDIISFINEVVDNKLLDVKKYRGNDIVQVKQIVSTNGKLRSDIKDAIKNADIKDENLSKALKLISEKKNIFITGHAGAGKSYILEKLKEIIPYLVITSTTGIAAVNVKGQTIHSWSGIRICNLPVEKTVENILNNYSLRTQIRDCRILAIDEISMLDIKTFEYLDEVLRMVRNKFNKPFGGIQVIFIGDFYQLPPVDQQNSELKNGYCFESKLWDEFDFQPIILTKNYRQNEKTLIDALSNIRINAMTNSDKELFRTREIDNSESLKNVLHIFSTNEEARLFNDSNFNKIESKPRVFQAEDTFYCNYTFDISKYCKAEKELFLKTGARVILLINSDFEKGLINGACGNVLEMEKDYILVKFDNGQISEIKKHSFEFYKNSKVIASREQFPLQLAYGITIHKSQGMTLDKLVVDCSRIFEKGQLYVALSRIRTLDGLYLVNFDPDKIKVDQKVVEFYNNLGNNKNLKLFDF